MTEDSEIFDKQLYLRVANDLMFVILMTWCLLIVFLKFDSGKLDKLPPAAKQTLLGISLVIVGGTSEVRRRAIKFNTELEACLAAERVERIEQFKRLKTPPAPKSCWGCKYLFSNLGIHCAVYPDANDVPEHCLDFEKKLK